MNRLNVAHTPVQAKDRRHRQLPATPCVAQHPAATGHQPSGPSPGRNERAEKAASVDESPRAQKRRERQRLKDQLLTAACRELTRRPPAGTADAEEAESVDAKQKARFKRIRRAIRAQGTRLAAQGTIVASWKTHAGKRLGPYYRLAYRVEGRQKSLYLGASAWLVAQVRKLLHSLQAPYREHRTLQRLKRHARQAFCASRKHLASMLRQTLGARLQGWEFRGAFRPLRKHAAEAEKRAYAARAANAQRIIRGETILAKRVNRNPSEDRQEGKHRPAPSSLSPLHPPLFPPTPTTGPAEVIGKRNFVKVSVQNVHIWLH